MNEIIFSHRPLAGISVGVCDIEGGSVRFAYALTNDGTSLNQIYHADRCDSFCRKTARMIIRGRLESNSSSIIIGTDLSSRQFIAEFRKLFKPTVDETDDVFCDYDTDQFGVDTRFRKSPRGIMDVLAEICQQAADSVVA